MKILQVNGYSLSEVKKQVPFYLTKNATQMWKKSGCPTNSEELEAFMAQYLLKNTSKLPNGGEGVGCYIVLDSAVSDSRDNPYKILNIPTTEKRVMKRVYELVNIQTNQIIGTADSKEAAIKLAKNLVTTMKTELGENVKHICRITKVVEKGDPIAFTFEYTPSINTKQGTFLCFGKEATK